MNNKEIFENLVLPLKKTLPPDGWDFLLSRGDMFINQSEDKRKIDSLEKQLSDLSKSYTELLKFVK